MGISGVKIRLKDIDLIRQFGNAVIMADPAVAKKLVEKGKAKIIDIGNVTEIADEKDTNESKEESETKEIKRVNLKKNGDNQKIFPETIIKEN